MNEFTCIPRFEGFYQMNQNGDVKSIARKLVNKRGSFISKEKIMNPVKDSSGYLFVYLRKNGKRSRCAIHRMLAILFIPNPECKPQVNHINGIKDDNRLENLEWASASENQTHAYRLGLHTPKTGKENVLFGRDAKGEKSPNSRIIFDQYSGVYFFGIPEAAGAKGISFFSLKGKLSGKTKKNDTGLIYA